MNSDAQLRRLCHANLDSDGRSGLRLRRALEVLEYEHPAPAPTPGQVGGPGPRRDLGPQLRRLDQGKVGHGIAPRSAAIIAPPRRGSELRALRRLHREQVPPSPYVFTTERLTPMTAAGFRKQLSRIGMAAEFPFPVHPHMLRHACGFKLAHDGHDTRAIQEWLGHRNIQHTTRYTELTTKRFRACSKTKPLMALGFFLRARSPGVRGSGERHHEDRTRSQRRPKLLNRLELSNRL
jgi:hypothetical protein